MLISVLANGAPVGEQACKKIAAEFLKSRNSRIETAQLKLVSSSLNAKSSSQSPAYYIYEAPVKGFVIVSSDDSVPPILGYSTENNLSMSNPAPNFLSWMQMWEKIIDSNRKHKVKADSKVAAAWKNVTAPAKTTSGPSEMQLETALWDQGEPFNTLCPKDGGVPCLTGCTATALAIIMRYHKWPDAGVGTLPGYSTGNIEVPSIQLGEKYDWDNMPLVYYADATPAQKHAVATIMYHLGAMIQSSYTPTSTSAKSTFIVSTVTKFMKYDDSQFHSYADLYSRQEWIENIKRSIQNNCPVHYSGYSLNNEGHAFVADGYDAQDNIRINFGWSGFCNGYYAVPDFQEFTMSHNAIFNLKKREGPGTAEPNIVLRSVNGSKGIEISLDGKKATHFETGKTMEVNVGSFCNYSSADFNGELGVGKWNKDGKLVEVLMSLELQQSLSAVNGNNYYYYNLYPQNCMLREPIREGDTLRAMFREKGGEWTACPYQRDNPDFTGEINIEDTRPIEESTTVKLDAQKNLMVIKAKDGVDIKLLDSSGSEVRAGVTIIESGLNIDVTKLTKGTYKLVLTNKNEKVEMEVEL